ncbi:MAG: D-glycero-beta-D-manno-heptose-7-phosphate kinase [Candidatus Omnitrophica bacterium]|nr:D-glycero-beta-D-manno-heptose-7-phosphate kinase [Candidatus Omnitrophota bacterium]
MKYLQFQKIKRVIDRFDNTSILVVGDIMLDEFIWGSVSRISPEAPVPVVHASRESFMPGGASNVAHNIKALGGEVYLAGVIGRDQIGKALVGDLERRGVNTSGVFCDDTRPTTLKTRVIAHNQQVVRIDKEVSTDVDNSIVRKILEFTERIIDDIDAIIIEDYGKGVVVSKLIQNLIYMARSNKKAITVDPKENHFSFYKRATAITPNHHEAAMAAGLRNANGVDVEKVGKKLLGQLKCEALLVTLGENGMCVFEKGGRVTRIPTVAQDVYDVSGAGDTVISAYTMAIAAGARHIEAAHIANCAAGIVVGKVGIAVAERGELLKKIKREIMKKRK